MRGEGRYSTEGRQPLLKEEKMDLQLLRNCSLSQKGAVEDFPFGDDVSVMKVGSKMFALISERDGTPKITLKCDPIIAAGLREKYNAVTPGYYMNKQH